MHSLIPIALAYVIAHYCSLLLYQGQAIAYLISDPLGPRLGHLRDGRQDDRLQRDHGERGLVRAGGRARGRPRLRPRAGARPRAVHVSQPARGDALAVLDARGDDRRSPASASGCSARRTRDLPIAHFGHWYVTLLYMGPVIVLVGALSFQSWREKRRKNGRRLVRLRAAMRRGVIAMLLGALTARRAAAGRRGAACDRARLRHRAGEQGLRPELRPAGEVAAARAGAAVAGRAADALLRHRATTACPTTSRWSRARGPTRSRSRTARSTRSSSPGTIGADGQAMGAGCVYPSSVKTVADQLTAAGLTWGGYMEDMGNTTTGDKTCRHPALNSPDSTQQATATDQYAARHNPFVYFHSIIDSPDCHAARRSARPPAGRPAVRRHDAEPDVHHARPVLRRPRRAVRRRASRRLRRRSTRS